MPKKETDILLRITIGESDRYHGKPLYEAIVLKAREMHIAGATVFRGIMGFGANSRINYAKILSLSTDLPIVVEIVDTQEKIDSLLPFLDEAVADGIVTMETIHVYRYRDRKGTFSR